MTLIYNLDILLCIQGFLTKRSTNPPPAHNRACWFLRRSGHGWVWPAVRLISGTNGPRSPQISPSLEPTQREWGWPAGCQAFLRMDRSSLVHPDETLRLLYINSPFSSCLISRSPADRLRLSAVTVFTPRWQGGTAVRETICLIIQTFRIVCISLAEMFSECIPSPGSPIADPTLWPQSSSTKL